VAYNRPLWKRCSAELPNLILWIVGSDFAMRLFPVAKVSPICVCAFAYSVICLTEKCSKVKVVILPR
jgi:hypothetical protein